MITIKIETDNDAFEQDKAAEIAEILRKLAVKFERGKELPISLFDSNGNKVGVCEDWS